MNYNIIFTHFLILLYFPKEKTHTPKYGIIIFLIEHTLPSCPDRDLMTSPSFSLTTLIVLSPHPTNKRSLL